MNVYEARHAGREYCNTEGSEHYKGGEVEPLDLIIAKGLQDGFCIGNMIKYAARFQTTRNPDDLKKVSDYAHILCGVELAKKKEERKNRELLRVNEGASRTARTMCSDRKVGKDCETCPVGRNANIEHISCSQYIDLDPKLACELLAKDSAPTVREVKRPAKVGEWMKITRPSTAEFMNAHDPVRVIEELEKGVKFFVSNRTCRVLHESYVVLEGYEPDKEGR